MTLKSKERKREYNKKYRESHKEHIKEHMKEYWENNREKLKKQHKLYHKNNLKKEHKRSKLYRENNPEKEKKRRERWGKNNSEYYKQWRENHLEYFSQYFKNKRRTDLKYNLNNRMSIAIGLSLKGNKNGRSWESLTGYTLADLIKRLNKTMPVGYTWQDFLEAKLHIDHIIPVKAFNFTRSEHTDFKRCWALSNLRLLPAKENFVKNAKLFRPFQPALRI